MRPSSPNLDGHLALSLIFLKKTVSSGLRISLKISLGRSRVEWKLKLSWIPTKRRSPMGDLFCEQIYRRKTGTKPLATVIPALNAVLTASASTVPASAGESVALSGRVLDADAGFVSDLGQRRNRSHEGRFSAPVGWGKSLHNGHVSHPPAGQCVFGLGSYAAPPSAYQHVAKKRYQMHAALSCR